MKTLRRYQFSERLADILGLPRRDLRTRVMLLVTGGIVPPGPRGPAAPPATPDYAANLLISAMAAPQQTHTVEAVRCYRDLVPAATLPVDTPSVIVGRTADRVEPWEPPDPFLVPGHLRFGDTLASLLEQAHEPESRDLVAHELFGVWVSRGFPVAAVQVTSWSAGRCTLVTQKYELADGAPPPAWLDPRRGGLANPGLLHTVFLPVGKLIEIARLTTQDPRKTIMLNTHETIAHLARLTRERRFRGPWQTFLTSARAARAATERIDARESSHLVEVTGFGTNPGNLRMFKYVPPGLPAAAPMVVALHGCALSAAYYAHGSGWTTLGDRFGFAVLLPQQNRANNPLRCFNWFRGEDIVRDSGEPESMRQMVERMIADHGVDAKRVYVTGVSAGGAMTSVMLATYPELFAGGAIICGLPYGCADNVQDAFKAAFLGPSRTAVEWGDRVRGASNHGGRWPKISVWHGSADTTVNTTNVDEILKQWTDVHGLSSTPRIDTIFDGHSHRVWQDTAGEEIIEAYIVKGMGHGLPIDPRGQEGCGHAMPFMLDVGVSSTLHIARFWGLADSISRAAATEAMRPRRQQERSTVGETEHGTKDGPSATVIDHAAHARADHESRRYGSTIPLDITGVISKAFEIASVATRTGLGAAFSGPRGVDVQGIVSKAFELVDLVSNGGHAESPGGDEGLAGSGWYGEGWELRNDDARALRGGPLLYGHTSSGHNCDTGAKIKSVTREVTLGAEPRLTYVRQLDLNATVNVLTRARFGVLVDGELVDEVSVVGMAYAEKEWTEKADINLRRFAGRTVELTFMVEAFSNVCVEVFAKAWLRGVAVYDTSAIQAWKG